MAIIWTAEVAGEIIASGEAQSAVYTAYEIAGGLVAAGWTVAAGIAYWFGSSNPPAPPFVALGWCNADGSDGKQSF